MQWFLRTAAVLAALAAAPASAQEAAAPEDEAAARIERIRRIAAQGAAETPNADRTTVIAGEALPFPDRAVLLGFVDGLRAELERQLGARRASAELLPAVSFRGPAYRVLVRAAKDDADPDAPASIRLSIHPRRNPASALPAAVIDIANPANDLDSREFATTVVHALLVLKAVYAAPEGRDVPVPVPPEWFAAGLARLMDPAARQADYDAVRETWFRAALPPLPELAWPVCSYAEADPAIAAQVAAFWLSFPDPAARFRDLCAKLGSGERWTSGLFVATSVGTEDLLVGDRAFDAWLWGRDRHILSPGATTPELVARTLVDLQVIPGRDGVPADFADRPQPLERLAEPENAAWAPAAAAALRARILRRAAGRGDAFRAAAGEFAAILDDLPRGGRRARRALERLPAARAALTASVD
jgi:hypothetical protein